MTSDHLITFILNRADEWISTIGVYRDGQVVTKEVDIAELDEQGKYKWECRCGGLHLLKEACILFADKRSVRIRTRPAITGPNCTKMDEEWTLAIPAQPKKRTREQQFIQNVRQAIEKLCNRLPDRTFDHRPSQIVARHIDGKKQQASWILCEHLRNDEYTRQEGVQIWSQAQFRYSLWHMTDSVSLQIISERVLTVHRHRHRWGLFQHGNRRRVTEDLFVIVPNQ